MSNTILLGTIKAIKESGLRIPDDISVVSFDNYTYLDYLDPAITRVSQRISEMGALAVKILLQRRCEDPALAAAHRLQLGRARTRREIGNPIIFNLI